MAGTLGTNRMALKFKVYSYVLTTVNRLLEEVPNRISFCFTRATVDEQFALMKLQKTLHHRTGSGTYSNE